MRGDILLKLHRSDLHIAQYKVYVGKSEGTAHLGDLDIHVNEKGGHSFCILKYFEELGW